MLQCPPRQGSSSSRLLPCFLGWMHELKWIRRLSAGAACATSALKLLLGHACLLGRAQKLASSTEETLRRGRSGGMGTPGALWGANLGSSGLTPMPGAHALSGIKRTRRDLGRTPLSAIKGQGAPGASLLASDVARSVASDAQGWGAQGLVLESPGMPQAFRGTPLTSGAASAAGLVALTPRGVPGGATPGAATPGFGQTPMGQLVSGGAPHLSTPFGVSPLATPSFDKGKSPLEMAFRVTPSKQAGLGTPTASQKSTGAGAAPLQPKGAPGAVKGITFGGKWAGASDGDDDDDREGDEDTPDRRPPVPAPKGRDVQVRPGLVTGMVSYWGGPQGRR